MSALLPKADIVGRNGDVRFVPLADILRCSKKVVIRSPLFAFAGSKTHGASVERLIEQLN
jgi:hypothetical protein